MDHNSDPNSDFPADSFFDVLFVIDIDAFGGTFEHVTQEPLSFHGEISGIPPFGAVHSPWDGGEYQVAGTGTGSASAALQDEDSTCDPGDPIAIPILDVRDLSVVGYICDATLVMPSVNSISVLKEAEGGQPLSGWKISLFAGAGCDAVGRCLWDSARRSRWS